MTKLNSTMSDDFGRLLIQAYKESAKEDQKVQEDWAGVLEDGWK